MLTQPTNILPSRLSGVGAGTVDITGGLRVSWQVNGSAPVMTAFRITLYNNDTSSTELYTTGKITLSSPFYGCNAIGVAQTFGYTISNEALTTAGLTNGGSYKMNITQWWSETDSVTTTSPAVFITRTAPTLNIASVPFPLTARSYTFSADYTQEQGDSIEWVRWEIYKYSASAESLSEAVKLYDSGNIFGASVLETTYDGFFPADRVLVRCTVQTVNGVQATAARVVFVSYPQEDISGFVDVAQLCGGAGVKVEWSNIAYIQGVGSGSYQTTGDSLILADGASVRWDTVTGSPMSFPYDWTVLWSASSLPTNPASIKNLLEVMLGTVPLWIGISPNNELTVTLDGDVIATQPLTGLTAADIITAVITPDTVSIQHVGGVGGLYPSDTLYPTGTLYPAADTGTELKGVYRLNTALPNEPITGLELMGRQICRYLFVENEAMTAAEIAAAMNTPNYRPTANFSEFTLFAADFAHGLQAGNFFNSDIALTGFSVYRSDGDNSPLRHVADAPLSRLSLIDYAAVAQNTAQYYMFGRSGETYATAAMVSSPITPCWSFWSVLECADNGDNEFSLIREYVFRYSLSSGAFTNNNTPAFQNNFTPYPLYQPVPQNYASGSLSGFIGTIARGRYTDTITARKAVTALSTNGNALFLKSPKGDLWRIAISAAVSVSIGDGFRELPQTIQLPWTEIASAEGVSIISYQTIAQTMPTPDAPVSGDCSERCDENVKLMLEGSY